MTQDPNKQNRGLEQAESDSDARRRRDRARAAYQYFSSIPQKLTTESQARLDDLKVEAGLDNQALPPGFKTILEKAGVGHQLPPVVAYAPMKLLNIPTPPFRDAIQPTSVIDWSPLDADENVHAVEAKPSVASVLFSERKPDEAVAERNARWLQVFDSKALQTKKGAQANAIRDISLIEGVKADTVKRGIQDAQKARHDRLLGGDSGTVKTQKQRPATPFDGLLKKGERSP